MEKDAKGDTRILPAVPDQVLNRWTVWKGDSELLTWFESGPLAWPQGKKAEAHSLQPPGIR